MPEKPKALYDAHCHLQDPRLSLWLSQNESRLAASGIRRTVVNGTSPRDWPQVVDLSDRYDWVIPSIGLHPWYVNTVDRDWKDAFRRQLDTSPCAVGEIGLDKWIEGYDIEAQIEAFLFQYRQARERGLPVSIHCLRCWGILLELLQDEGPYDPGFLLHSYGGPKEMVNAFAVLGGRFSISGYFAHERKAKSREAFGCVPLDRLLIETDAPDMLGPAAVQSEILTDPSGVAINSPLNIGRIYEFVAEMKGMSLDELAPIVGKNFRQLFGLWEK